MREGVERLLTELLRPLVEADGGTVEVLEIEERRIVLRLGGACAGCPGAPYTKGSVITPLIQGELGVDFVVDFVTGHSPLTAGRNGTEPDR